MKQVNFTHPGGFPLEQETLERLQTAYRSELYEAIKSHLSIVPNTNYIIAHAQSSQQGWAIIHQDGEGILYPITGSVTNYLKTTRTITNLIYGDGNSQTAYTDYKAEYVTTLGVPTTNDTETVKYYDLNTFKTVKSIQAIEEMIAGIENRTKSIETTLPTIDNRINTIKNDLESYLPLDGSKAMKGDLNLGTHQLYLNNLNTGTSSDFLLSVNNQNQVVKNNTLLSSLIDRIEILENKPASSPSIPIGMIAIWSKPAPFPEGWEEYVPLRGRMPIGLDTNDSAFDTLLNYGGNKQKTLTINEIPPHTHTYDKAISGRGYQTRSDDNPLGSNVSETSGSTGGGLPFSILNPYRIVHFIEYTGRAADNTPPTSPNNLTVSNIDTTSLTLNWTASIDNIGVTNYLVYKDNGNTLLAELGKDVLTYNVTGLLPSTTYSFQVKAKDAAGNLSNPATINATTSNTPVPPTVPTLQYGYSSGENMILQWPNYIDEGPIVYELYRSINDGTPMLIKTSTDTFYYDTLSIGVTYSYQIRINYNGYTSNYSNTVRVTARL